MLRLAVVLLVLAIATPVAGQEVSVRGVVRDAASDEPIPYAAIEIVGTARRFSADAEGRYLVRELARGTWTLRAYSIGHDELEARLVVTDSTPATIFHDFLLTPRPFDIEGLTVEGQRARTVPEEPVGAPPARIERSRIAATPTAFEPDILQVIQTLPSVANASDYSSALYVRGGTPDQTTVLLDGTPLFNPYHVGGLFSAIDAALVEDVVAHVGPMSATLGDRLAGIVEINSRAPPLAGTRAWGNIGLISASAGMAAPLGDGGYTLALRHTYVDLATRAAYELGLMKTAFPYGFTDGYAHLRQRLGSGEFRISGYLDSEYVSPPGEELPDDELDFAWGTGAASTSWEGFLGQQLSMRTSLGFSRFDGDLYGRDLNDPGPPILEANFINQLVRPAVDFLWLAGERDVRFGAALEHYGFDYDVQTTDEGLSVLFPEHSESSTLTTLAAHAETEWHDDDARTHWRVGLRALAAEEAGVALLPRVGWSHDLDDELALFASIGRKAQAVRSLRSEEAVFSSVVAYDLLAPSGDRFSIGDEIAGGVDWRPFPTTSLRLEGYARRAREVGVAPVPGNIYFTPVLVPNKTARATDLTAGLEVSGTHRHGGTEVWLSYSGSWLQRTVGDESFTPRFHRMHHLQLLGAQSISGRTVLSASVQLGSGQPYTGILAWHQPRRFDPTSGAWHISEPELILDERNTSRLPFYFRLDLGLRSSFTPRMFGRDVTIAPYLSVLNAIGYRNSMFVVYDIFGFGTGGPEGNGNVTTTHAPQMPLLPTFGMEWRF